MVEDEAPIREGMVKILSKINPDYVVVGKAEDGQKGYELICRERPDLVIMDIKMPKMDGLTMLGKIKAEHIPCKAIVLSAYSEFEYAKQAIAYGVTGYLLKPIKIPELKYALQQAEEEIQKEKGAEQAFSLENIFLFCLNGQVKADDAFCAITQEKYGFTVKDPVEFFLVWMGDRYHEQKQRAKVFLDNIAARSAKYDVFVQEVEGWNALLVVLYRFAPGQSQYEYYRKVVFPKLYDSLEKPVIGVWRGLDHLIDVPRILPGLKKDLEWNLWFPGGTLIRREEIDKLRVAPMKYPEDLEEKVKKALLKKDCDEVAASYEKLYEYFMQDIHSPDQIKEIMIHFNWNIVNSQKNRREESDLKIQNILQRIAIAVTWEEIKAAMEEFMDIVAYSLQDQEEPSVSEIVQRAKDLIRKYYNQGITLEEAAGKLFISEEYLSTQFKKETGYTFTETVRKYRIEKVKELLLETSLKLNQIAELAGYSNPKYMSKVFKDEVGMLPTEFRKSVH